ncbi:MAG: DEAD/DEAH box helicase family protein, partial [Bacteroidales bacterium]|nr:DEAD/DEAH box helicase family protein [Bacteroidales bacterium]
MDNISEQLKHASTAELEELLAQIQEMKEKAAAREEAERQKQLQKEREEREHAREVTSMELPLDWENAFAADERAKGLHADNPEDGLMLSLSNLGRVDIEYIAEVTGADCKSVIGALKGTIYQNPDTWEECFYKGWETADQYLSGNLKRKWDAASRANEAYYGYFADNVKAIEAVLPPAVSFRDIYITLGSPWVPPDVIDEFITHLFGLQRVISSDGSPYFYDLSKCWPTRHDEWTGTWEVLSKSRYGKSVAVTQKFGTERVGALYLLEKALNMQTPIVHDTTFPSKVDQMETLAAIEKQQELIRQFQDWVWTDSERTDRLIKIYEERFSCVRTRRYDGSWLRFPTMSPQVSLYPYQKDAVARILFSPNTLLAHEVGAGKTYVMVAAGMEMLRVGMSEKNLYVVPNNLIGQWRTIFLGMYPEANLLCVEPKSFTPKKREGVLQRIRDERFDGIIMAYSCFGLIPLSKSYYMQKMEGEQDIIKRLMLIDEKVTPALRRRKKAVEKAIRELLFVMDSAYDTVYFDQMGITRLFVDEAHNFKNIPIRTNVNNVLGVSGKGSQKCADMLDKVRCVERQNNGGGVVMATGTPITNSLTDIY